MGNRFSGLNRNCCHCRRSQRSHFGVLSPEPLLRLRLFPGAIHENPSVEDGVG